MKTRLTAILLLTALLAGCGANPVDPEDNPADTNAVQESDQTDSGTADDGQLPYDIPAVDLEEGTLTVLNPPKDYWNTYTTFDMEELTGENLNDAVFHRNRAAEEEFNFQLKVEEVEFWNVLAQTLRNSISSGEDAYQAAFTKPEQSTSIITDGGFHNLYDFESMHLDKPWWDQYIIENLTVGDSLPLVSGPLHLMAVELTATVYINKELIVNAGMDLPYEMVYNGTWTMDELYNYATSLSDIGTQETWKFSPAGDAIHPMGSIKDAYRHMLFGIGESLIDFDENNLPVYKEPSQRYYDAAEIIAKLFDMTTPFMIDHNRISSSFGVSMGSVFAEGRIAVYFSEMCTAHNLREMEGDYCIVPCPKLDEEQENYCSTTSWQSAMLTIPVTNAKANETAAIMDYMAYYSLNHVWPEYLNKTIQGKGTRDEESVDMLNIIRDTITIDAGSVYNWTTDLSMDLANKFAAGDSAIASSVAKYKEAIGKNIEKFLNAIAE